MGTLCSITNVFKDADGKFQVFFIETEGNQIQTQVLAPLNENGTVDFSLKNPSVFLNGAELVYNSDYSLTSWEDTTDGKKKVQVNAMGDLTFKEKDYVLVWMQTKLKNEDIQFTSGQKITSAKLNQIFQSFLDKLEELRSAGFAFASNTLFSKLAEGLQTVLDQYTQDKETELDNYVENTNKPTLNDYVDNTLKPDLDNYVNNTNKPELDNYVDNTLKPDLDNYVNNTNKPELDNYVDNTLKPDLDNYVNNTNKPELDNYVDNTLKPDLDNYTDQKKNEINDTASYLDVDKVDGKDASDFTPISHDTATQGVHGIVTPYFIAKTSREDQFPDWMDVQNKPFATRGGINGKLFNKEVYISTSGDPNSDGTDPSNPTTLKAAFDNLKEFEIVRFQLAPGDYYIEFTPEEGSNVFKFIRGGGLSITSWSDEGGNVDNVKLHMKIAEDGESYSYPYILIFQNSFLQLEKVTLFIKTGDLNPSSALYPWIFGVFTLNYTRSLIYLCKIIIEDTTSWYWFGVPFSWASIYLHGNTFTINKDYTFIQSETTAGFNIRGYGNSINVASGKTFKVWSHSVNTLSYDISQTYTG